MAYFGRPVKLILNILFNIYDLVRDANGVIAVMILFWGLHFIATGQGVGTLPILKELLPLEIWGYIMVSFGLIRIGCRVVRKNFFDIYNQYLHTFATIATILITAFYFLNFSSFIYIGSTSVGIPIFGTLTFVGIAAILDVSGITNYLISYLNKRGWIQDEYFRLYQYDK